MRSGGTRWCGSAGRRGPRRRACCPRRARRRQCRWRRSGRASNTVPLLSVTCTLPTCASMRAMSPKRAMNGRPRLIDDPGRRARTRRSRSCRFLGPPRERRMGGPGVLVLGAVEVVAPERLLVASPAQPPLVGGAVNVGDPTVEEARVDLRRGLPSAIAAGLPRRVRRPAQGGVANDESEERRTSAVTEARPAIVARVMVMGGRSALPHKVSRWPRPASHALS